jgi:hypothetical protein
MKTMTIAAAVLALSAVSAGAQVSLEQARLFAPRLSATSIEVPEVSAPARAVSFGEKSAVAVDPDMDTAKAARMQELALEKISIKKGGGGCYGAVWHDVLVQAGFDDGGLIPGTHAYEFAKHAKENPEWFLNVFRMKRIPTPDSIDEMPAGSVVVYDRGQRDPYGRASGESGHIEVIADRDGVRYGCSDFCADIGGMGPMFADEYSKEHVSVFIPVK